MKLKEYHVQAARTLNTTLPSPTGIDSLIVYAAMGLAGEAGEFRKAVKDYLEYTKNDQHKKRLLAKVIEELGDFNWQLVILFRSIFSQKDAEYLDTIASVPQWYCENDAFVAEDLVETALVLLELVKKAIYHKHEWDYDKVLELFKKMYNCSSNSAQRLCGGMDVVLQTNVEKLIRRYPQGFTYNNSQNRIDEKHV